MPPEQEGNVSYQRNLNSIFQNARRSLRERLEELCRLSKTHSAVGTPRGSKMTEVRAVVLVCPHDGELYIAIYNQLLIKEEIARPVEGLTDKEVLFCRGLRWSSDAPYAPLEALAHALQD